MFAQLSLRPSPRRALVLVGILTAGIVAASAVPASAHAELESSSPADGSTVTKAPSQVVLTFGEDLQSPGRALVVTAPDGSRVDSGKPVVDGVTLSVALQSLEQPGVYTVAYRVVSADGHPVSGQLSFTFQPAGSQATPAPPASPSTSAAASSGGPTGSGRSPWLWILAVVLVAGVVLVWLTQRGRRA